MKTTLLKNTCDLILFLIGQLLELLLRLIRFIIPMGLYHYFLQMMPKPVPVTALRTYLTPKSTFTFVAPGIILVTVDGTQYKDFFKEQKRKWDKFFPTFSIILQCSAYACIIVYFIYALIKG